MASPQPDRFVKLSKEFLQALKRTRIPGVERQVLDTIMDHTWGGSPSKTWCALRNKQFCEETGLSAVAVCKALKSLEAKKMIEVENVTKNGNKNAINYRIQKDFDIWNLLPKKVILPKMVTNVTKFGNKNSFTPILEKKNREKEKKTVPVFSSLLKKNAQVVIDRINELSGKSFRDTKPIEAVMKSKTIKATVEDCLKVVEYKWQSKFVRENGFFTPASLFRITKFSSKLDEANNAKAAATKDPYANVKLEDLLS